MSYQFEGEDMTLIAAADLSASQFMGVKVDSAGKAALCVAGDFAIGVLQNKPAAGQAATVRFAGCSKMVAGGTITAGDKVATDAAAKGKTAVATSVSGATVVGSNVIGIALESAVVNDIFPVLIDKAGAAVTTLA